MKKKKTSDTSKKCISPNKIKALIVFGKMHFLGISENNFFHEIKRIGMTSFMDFLIFTGLRKGWSKYSKGCFTKPCNFKWAPVGVLRKNPRRALTSPY